MIRTFSYSHAVDETYINAKNSRVLYIKFFLSLGLVILLRLFLIIQASSSFLVLTQSSGSFIVKANDYTAFRLLYCNRIRLPTCSNRFPNKLVELTRNYELPFNNYITSN